MDLKSTPEPTPAPVAEPSPSTQTPAPAANTLPTPGKSGSFVANALKQLSDLPDPAKPAPAPEPAKETPKVEVQPPEPAKETPKSEHVPKKDESAADPDEDARAEADIQRETKSMSQAHKAAFTKLRYEARDLKRQLKAATAAKEEATTPAETAVANEEITRIKAEYEAMKAKVENYEKEAFTTRLEATEVFQKEVIAPRQETAEAIAGIAERYKELDQDAVIAAVRSGDPERVSRVTADMSEYDRFSFYELVKGYQRTIKRESEMRENSKDTVERVYREQREREEAKRAEEKSQWEKSTSEVWAQLEEDFPVLSPVDGDEDWNSALEGVKTFATPDRFEKLTVRERVEALHRAAAFPVLVSELETVVGQLKEAQEKLSKYESATPGLGSDPTGASPDGIVKGGSFIENALNSLRKAGAR